MDTDWSGTENGLWIKGRNVKTIAGSFEGCGIGIKFDGGGTSPDGGIHNSAIATTFAAQNPLDRAWVATPLAKDTRIMFPQYYGYSSPNFYINNGQRTVHFGGRPESYQDFVMSLPRVSNDPTSTDSTQGHLYVAANGNLCYLTPNGNVRTIALA